MRISTAYSAAIVVPMLIATQLRAGNVISDWNTIASTAIVKTAGVGPAASAVYFTYASLAAYDAVNAITGQYKPFYYPISGPRGASVDAAAVAAEHLVLVNYFPAQKDALDAQFASSIAAITDSDASKQDGVTVGEAAAMALISARTGDGVAANVIYTPLSGPGAWIPTPPAFSAPVTPWLGQMRPFTMKSASDYLPDGPPPLTSETWKRDYNLTRMYGGSTSTIRSAAETEIGIFWTEHTGQQYARMLNYLVADYNLGTADAARLNAMIWTSFADSGIACFNAKYHYGFWRPVTAIPTGGGNTELAADSTWLPLGTTPGHPEYPAAHGCITSGISQTLAGFFKTTRVRIRTDSVAFTDGVHSHTFQDARALMDEVFWARIYAGFHFYHSLEDGRQLGQTGAAGLLKGHFQRRR